MKDLIIMHKNSCRNLAQWIVVFVGFILINISFESCKRSLPGTQVLKPSYLDSSIMQIFRQTSGVTAGTGTSSLALNDGRILWLYGSAHVNDYDVTSSKISCIANVHNAGVIQTPSGGMQTLNTGAQDFIPSNEANTWFIPLHAYQFFDTVFVFSKKQGLYPVYGTYVAKFHFPDMQFIKVDSIPTSGYTFGYNIVSDTATGFCYTFGLHQPNPAASNDMYVARFLLNNPHSPWLYYSNGTWLNVALGATSVTKVPAENFCVRKVKGKYILLTQQAGNACNTGNYLFSSIAPEAWGPYNNPVTLYQISDKINNVSPVTFGASLHPHLLNANNEILITYGVNGYAPCVNTCLNGLDNPDYYRNKTLRVPLRNIDPTY